MGGKTVAERRIQAKSSPGIDAWEDLVITAEVSRGG